MDNRLNTKTEVAARLGPVSVDSVERKIAAGEIATVRIGRRVFVPETEMTRLLTPKTAEPQRRGVVNVAAYQLADRK